MGDKKPPSKSKPMKPLRPLRACKVPPKPPPAGKEDKKKEAISSSSSTTSTSSNSSASSTKSVKSFENRKKPGSDLALLRKSIDTSVSDLAQVIKMFQTGTPEVTNILTKECSVIYECNVCRNLFRSIANFLSHKRTYCTTKAADQEGEENGKVTEKTVLINGTKGNSVSSRTTTRQDILSILDSLTRKNAQVEVKENNTVTLSEVNGTTEALYLNNPVANADSESETERRVILGPDGKIVRSSSGTPDSQPVGMACNICSKTMDSYSQVMDHIRADHTEYKSFFICPVCKKYFVHLWSVSRHLVKVHRRPTDKVRKMRGALQKKKVSLEELAKMVGPSTKPSVDKPCQYNQEKAWLEELDVNADFQRCMGCGKKFDRKVALISHSQTCQKRPPSVSKEKPPYTPPLESPPAIPSPDFRPPQGKCQIQVRMFYGKEGSPRKAVSEDVAEKSFVTRDLSLFYTNSESSSVSPMPQLSPVVSEKDETDRYKKDFELQDKCVRLEAKLLQLHKAAADVKKQEPTAPEPSYNHVETTSQDVIVLSDEEDSRSTFDNGGNVANEENLVTSTVGSSDPLALDDMDSDSPDLNGEKWILSRVRKNCKASKCLICDRYFRIKSSLFRHVAVIHLQIFRYKCLAPKCNFKAYLAKDFTRHHAKMHSELPISSLVKRLHPKESDIKLIKNGKRKGKRKKEEPNGESNQKKICLGKEYFESKLSSSLDMMSTEEPNSNDPDTVRAVMMEVLFGRQVTSEIVYNHIRDESSEDEGST